MRVDLILALGWRYLRSKRYGALSRFMSAAAVGGIAVGTAALIIGLAAMNGFEYELKHRVLAVIPAAWFHAEAPLQDAEGDLRTLTADPRVAAAAPAAHLDGVLAAGRNFAPVTLIGIDPERERAVIPYDRFIDRDPATWQDGEIFIGAGIARRLGLTAGDTVGFLTAASPNGRPWAASGKPLRVGGQIRTGGQLDQALAFCPLTTALRLAGMSGPDYVHLRTQDLLRAEAQAAAAARALRRPGEVRGWMRSQGKLYRDIQMIRAVMYLAMILILGVAAFNIVANLLMAVSEKRREIAVLLTLGAGRGLILGGFTLMGVLCGLKGCLYGVLGGSLLAWGIAPLTARCENWFGFTILNPEIYFVSYVPTKLTWTEVAIVTGCALLMSLLASLYPAWRATKIVPPRELAG